MRYTIQRAKVVLNIHFYDDALLETNKIFEALSFGTPVVSEIGSDQDEHTGLTGVVDFTRLGEIGEMAEAIDRLLRDEAHYSARQSAIRQFVNRSENRFTYGMRSFLADERLIAASGREAETATRSAPATEGTVGG